MKKMVDVISFTVTGPGSFPLDMLRYDSAWPSTTDDALRIEAAVAGTVRGKQGIRITALQFTPARWESFGWKLDHLSLD